MQYETREPSTEEAMNGRQDSGHVMWTGTDFEVFAPENHVIVERQGAWSGEPESSLVIVTPDKPEIEQGVVVASTGMPDGNDPPVGPGERVIFNRYSGRDLWDNNGRDWVVLEPVEILAVVREDSETVA